MTTVNDTFGAQVPGDPASTQWAKSRIENLAIPYGSLGRLHEIAVRYAALGNDAQNYRSEGIRCVAVVFAGDHGICKHGVSAFHQEVTRSNVIQMLRGRATISVFAASLRIPLVVVDVGICGAEISEPPARGHIHFLSRRVRNGTADFTQGPAMTLEEAKAAFMVGFNTVLSESEGVECVVVGDMGIGNTSSASLITSTLLDVPVSEVTGSGSGIGPEQLESKKQILEEASLRIRSRIDRDPDPLEVISECGGLEIAAMAGAFLAAASRGKLALVDGFISTVAALIACRINSEANRAMLFCSKSTEPGSRAILQALSERPLLDLEMRLGEGTAAILAFPIVKAAISQLFLIGTIDEIVGPVDQDN